ncbi:ABC transporter permease [Corynebacterium pseudopelargi]|uniref:Glycine betaine/carnitine/choline transport system permease protein OpuCD n=1 Tax=Corynebacterium pseudopelargi TaxID=2080757 RepID=A0A3G6IRH9_9CORY|nr:ABC transporter permease subunit [Corynebacterium pseudopelargi]AZA08191.1 Glycine betaine/carnitine/choline transport system permease protein OpuCD [Corynebacterium pseudopelargi]
MTWLSHAWPQVWSLLLQHLALAVPAIVIAVLVATPLGMLAARTKRIGSILVASTALIYTVPALAMLVILPFIVGFPLRSTANVTTALALYGIALLVRTATDAFSSVPAHVRTAALAQGVSPKQLLWKVDLPLAIPVLISGIRVVCVSTIGLVTIGALIGVPSLGTLFTDGFQRGIYVEVLSGIVLVVLLALLFDALTLLIGRVLAPWEAKA